MQRSSSSANVSGMSSIKDSSGLHTPDRVLNLPRDGLPYSRPPTPGPNPHQLGFIGLGNMGYMMARNLANYLDASGAPALLVWNRSHGQSDKLVKELGGDKVRVAKSVEEIAQKSDILITSLPNDDVVKGIYGQIIDTLKAGDFVHGGKGMKILVETSTIYPTTAGELDIKISSLPHTHYVTCPVFGPPVTAEKAQLLLVLAGNYIAKKEVAYALVPAIGRKVLDLGGNVEKAPALKLVGNATILGTLELIAETMTLAEKSGVGADNFYEWLSAYMPTPTILNYGKRILEDNFEGVGGFALEGGLKDAKHVRRLAEEVNAAIPIIDTAHEHMLTARALHDNQFSPSKSKHKTLDWSALVAGPRVAAGLDAFDSKKHGILERD